MVILNFDIFHLLSLTNNLMLLIYHHFILNTSKHLKMLFELMWEDIAGLDVLVFLIFGIFGILFMGLLLFFKVGSIMGMGPKEIPKRIAM